MKNNNDNPPPPQTSAVCKRQAILTFFFFAYSIVIPDYAKMSWSVRADTWDALEPLRDRVVKCLEYA